MTRGVEHRRSP